MSPGQTILAMESDVNGAGMNIVLGESVSQRRIVELVLKACGSGLEPLLPEDQAHEGPLPASTFTYSRARARDLIGWEPRVSLEDGIARVVRWLNANAG